MLSLNLAATGVALAPAVAPRTTRTSGARGVSIVAASNPPWARRRWGCSAASGGVEAVECSSSGSRTGEELRALMDRLQAEAEATRSKGYIIEGNGTDWKRCITICSRGKSDSPIRIVSSKMVTSHDQNLEKTSEMESRKVPDSDSVDYTWPVAKFKQSVDSIDDEKLNTLMGVTSYEAFLEHVDIQLKGMEDDLLALLRVSNLVIGGEQRQENTNTRRTSEILKDVSCIRAKIADFIQNSTEES